MVTHLYTYYMYVYEYKYTRSYTHIYIAFLDQPVLRREEGHGSIQRAFFSAHFFFCALFCFWRPSVLAQGERKKERSAAMRTWREQDPTPQKECCNTLSPKRNVGLQHPKP